MADITTPCLPKYRIAKSQQRGDRPQIWTASRCHRLLRPLLSRISLLRKDLLSLSAQSVADLYLQEEDASETKRPAEDCSWLLPRKKLRRTYSQKSLSNPAAEPEMLDGIRYKAAKCLQRTSLDAEEVTAFTPLLRRARGEDASSPIQEVEHLRNHGVILGGKRILNRKSPGTTGACFEEGIASMRTLLPPMIYASYEAIIRSVEALLRGTHLESETQKGPSSFLDMCLKKIPAYIAGVQAWEAHNTEKNGTKSAFETSSASHRIYSDLESLGSSDYGWVHLRTVVRADALCAIKDAILEGLFHDDFTMLLIDLCAHCGAADEVDMLIEALIARQYPEPLNNSSTFSETPALKPLLYLRDFSLRTGRSSFLLRQCSCLLYHGHLPLAWLSTTEFERIWSQAYRIVSRGTASLEAVDLLVTGIVLLCRQQPQTKRPEGQHPEADRISSHPQALSQVLASLCAMKRLGEDQINLGFDLSSKLDKVARISRCLDYVLSMSIAEIECKRGRRNKLGDLLYLASFFSSAATPDGRLSVRILKSIELGYREQLSIGCPSSARIRKLYDMMIAFISSIAHLYSRGTSKTPHGCLKELCQQLEALGLPNEVVENINRAGAFFLAQQTNDLRDVMYAEQLAGGFGTDPASNSGGDRVTGVADTLWSGYRWEASIGEWVTVSPVAERKRPRRKTLQSLVRATARSASQNMEQAANFETPRPARRMTLSSLVPSSPTSQQSELSPRMPISAGITSRSVGNTTSHDIGNRLAPRKVRHASFAESCSRKVAAVDALAMDDKENVKQDRRDKIRSGHANGVQRCPLSTKRRITLSRIALHSDDELGM
ncbi:hypothetical protein BX600DRAFT_80016 [Xylariales sp. PMI_506]|nr:hypothetical protein BX600DRAFT_80016 [Xylariales sp. PMI_506]